MKKRYLNPILLISLICFLSMSAAAQSLHVIRGKIAGAGGKRIFLVEDMFYQKNNKADSVIADSDGSFSFKKMLSEPTIYVLGVKGGPVVDNQFIVDGPETVISAKADSIKYLHISGSRENILFKKVKSGFNIQQTMDRYRKTIDSAIAMKDLAGAARVKDLSTTWQLTSLKDSLTKFIEANKGTLTSAICLVSINRSLSAAEFQRNLLMVKTGSVCKNIINYLHNLNEITGPQPGSMAPNFTQADSKGIAVKLSDFRGKYVLVDFWASWCAPCRIEHPKLTQLYNKFKPKGFTILSVSLDESKEHWKKAIKDDQLQWTNVSDLGGWNNKVAKMYEVAGVPASFLIGPTGEILARNLRGVELEKKLEAIFK